MILMPCAMTAYMKIVERMRIQYAPAKAGATAMNASAQSATIARAALACFGIGKIAMAEKPARAQQQQREQEEKADRVAQSGREQRGDEVLGDREHHRGRDDAPHAAEPSEQH